MPPWMPDRMRPPHKMLAPHRMPPPHKMLAPHRMPLPMPRPAWPGRDPARAEQPRRVSLRSRDGLRLGAPAARGVRWQPCAAVPRRHSGVRRLHLGPHDTGHIAARARGARDGLRQRSRPGRAVRRTHRRRSIRRHLGWDGSTWLLRTPAVSPPALYGATMVYDAANARTILFGGVGPTITPWRTSRPGRRCSSTLARRARDSRAMCRHSLACERRRAAAPPEACLEHEREADDRSRGEVILVARLPGHEDDQRPPGQNGMPSYLDLSGCPSGRCAETAFPWTSSAASRDSHWSTRSRAVAIAGYSTSPPLRPWRLSSSRRW